MTRNLRRIATILELAAALIGLGLSIRALIEAQREQRNN